MRWKKLGADANHVAVRPGSPIRQLIDVYQLVFDDTQGDFTNLAKMIDVKLAK